MASYTASAHSFSSLHSLGHSTCGDIPYWEEPVVGAQPAPRAGPPRFHLQPLKSPSTHSPRRSALLHMGRRGHTRPHRLQLRGGSLLRGGAVVLGKRKGLALLLVSHDVQAALPALEGGVVHEVADVGGVDAGEALRSTAQRSRAPCLVKRCLGGCMGWEECRWVVAEQAGMRPPRHALCSSGTETTTIAPIQPALTCSVPPSAQLTAPSSNCTATHPTQHSTAGSVQSAPRSGGHSVSFGSQSS